VQKVREKRYSKKGQNFDDDDDVSELNDILTKWYKLGWKIRADIHNYANTDMTVVLIVKIYVFF